MLAKYHYRISMFVQRRFHGCIILCNKKIKFLSLAQNKLLEMLRLQMKKLKNNQKFGFRKTGICMRKCMFYMYIIPLNMLILLPLIHISGETISHRISGNTRLGILLLCNQVGKYLLKKRTEICIYRYWMYFVLWIKGRRAKSRVFFVSYWDKSIPLFRATSLWLILEVLFD